MLAIVLGVMLLYARLAHAAPAIAMTPTGIELSWQIWLVAGLAAAGGALKILDVVIAGLRWLAPRTPTKLDDKARDDLQIVRDDIAWVLKMLGALVPASGVPALAPDKPAAPTLVRAPGSGTAALLVVLLLGAAGAGALTSCTGAERSAAATSAGHALINCTAQTIGTTPGLDVATLVAIANTVAAERAKCMTPTGLDWKCVETDAIGQGVTLGGCAFVQLVAAAAKAVTSAGSSLAANPAPPPGRVELERFRASVAGGATFRTASGDQ